VRFYIHLGIPTSRHSHEHDAIFSRRPKVNSSTVCVFNLWPEDVKTLWTQDISAPVPKCPDISALVLKCLTDTLAPRKTHRTGQHWTKSWQQWTAVLV